MAATFSKVEEYDAQKEGLVTVPRETGTFFQSKQHYRHRQEMVRVSLGYRPSHILTPSQPGRTIETGQQDVYRAGGRLDGSLQPHTVRDRTSFIPTFGSRESQSQPTMWNESECERNLVTESELT